MKHSEITQPFFTVGRGQAANQFGMIDEFGRCDMKDGPNPLQKHLQSRCGRVAREGITAYLLRGMDGRPLLDEREAECGFRTFCEEVPTVGTEETHPILRCGVCADLTDKTGTAEALLIAIGLLLTSVALLEFPSVRNREPVRVTHLPYHVVRNTVLVGQMSRCEMKSGAARFLIHPRRGASQKSEQVVQSERERVGGLGHFVRVGRRVRGTEGRIRIQFFSAAV